MMAFPQEQVIVKREYSNGCFSAVAYYASKSTFLSVARGGQSVAIALLIYGMAGIYPRPFEFGNLVIYFCALCVVVVWSSCAGLLVGARACAVATRAAASRCRAPAQASSCRMPPPLRRSACRSCSSRSCSAASI